METVRIAGLVSPLSAYGQTVARGIAQYAHSRRNWVLRFPQSLAALQVEPDGIIAQVSSAKVFDLFRAAGCPVINVSSATADVPFPSVVVDNRAVGRLAADHLLARGLRQFAFIGTTQHYSDLRLAGFSERLQQERLAVKVYGGTKTGSTWSRVIDDASVRAERLAWLSALPKPVGLLAVADDIAASAVELCLALGLRVPDDVAVVGVDNSELICEQSTPPVSSVDTNGEQVGFEAARILDQWLAGKKPPRRPLLIAPSGVTVRGSSDAFAVPDPRVASALQYIHKNIHRSVRIPEISRHVGVNRRTLEKAFRHHLGGSIHDEIQRARLEQVKRLLAQTDLNMPRVAELAGFPSPQYMANVFGREIGATPSAYRRRHRAFRRRDNTK
jgi:LacI family transcriptional regulator